MEVSVDRCPSAALLESLLSEDLAGSQREMVETHVEHCASCQQALARMVPNTVLAPTSSFAIYQPQAAVDEAFLSRLKQLPIPRPAAADAGSMAEPRNFSRVIEQYAGRRLGQYQVLEPQGMGNMGVVYKALHVELGKIVALKILPATLMDEVSVARFKNEARAAGRMDHPNIVTIHDAGQLEGVHFLVMAFVDGTDLARLVKAHGQLAVADACELVRQAALGLQHAFERGLVHRDIKPSNLMLARDGLVKVLDLGIARSFAEMPASERLTATGVLLGTADYLAPEQWDNPNAVDTRADIYSLGCTLYHLLAGHAPFGPNYHSILTKMRAHLEEPVPPPSDFRTDIPPELVNVLDRMLAKNRDGRYASPGEVAEALRPFCAGSSLASLVAVSAGVGAATAATHSASITDTYPPAGERKQPDMRAIDGARTRRARRLAVLGVAAGLCAVVAALVALWPEPADRQRPNQPVKITTMSVAHYRGQAATLLGDLARPTEPVRTDDSVRVSATFSGPAYSYLLAFNPDGSEQLCYPEDRDLAEVKYPQHKDAKAMKTPPPKSKELRYPREQYFEPGLAGLQVFVLIASAEPLPAYAEWRSRFDKVPWRKVDLEDPERRWQFYGQDFLELPSQRGSRVERGTAPREFRELCNFFHDRTDVQAVRAIAFPVVKK